MLRPIPILTFVAALAASTVFAAQEVTTPPVGFITVKIVGAATAPAKPLRYNLIGVNMVNPVEFQGLSGAALTVASKTQITLTGITAAAFPGTNKYFLEIVSGTNEGVMIDITSIANDQVTLSENVTTSHFGSAVTVAVRKHNTLGSIFGTVSNLVLKGAEDPSEADGVQIFNSITQNPTTYYFNTAGGFWVEAGKEDDVTNTVLYPDEGVIVTRRGASDVNFKIVGSVKTGKTTTPLYRGFNIITYPYPVEASIGTTNLYTGGASGLTGGEDSSTADLVQFFNPLSQQGTSYYYNTAGSIWVETGKEDDVGTSLKMPIGASVIVTRRSSTPNNVSFTQPF